MEVEENGAGGGEEEGEVFSRRRDALSNEFRSNDK